MILTGMSNKIRIFFWIFSIGLGATPIVAPATPIDSLQSYARHLFDYERYPEAIQVYEDLFQQGYFQPDMLYRLAFMYEQLQEYPQSIYYLRILQWEIGGAHLEAKIEQLMDKGSRERLSAGEAWSPFELWIHHNENILITLLIISTILAAASLLIPGRIWKMVIGMSLSASVLITAGMWMYQQLEPETKAVVMQKSAYYDLPGYAATYRTLPISPGATVTILQEQDIWCNISMGQFQTWVPKFVVKEI